MSHKALLLRLSAMGDVTIAAAAVEMLHRHGFKVYLVTYKPFEQLFACDSRVKSVYGLNRPPSRDEILSLINELKALKVDLAFDIHRKPLTALLLKLSGAQRKYSYSKRTLERRMAVWFHKKIEFVPIAELYQRPIRKALGLGNDEFYRPHLLPCDDNLQLPENYIVIAPGAAYETRVWPHFGELCRMIREKMRVPVVVVGTKAELAPRKAISECMTARSKAPLIDMIGKTNVKGLVSLISGSAGFVGNDSGPMHIADALDVPTVAIFGPTIPEFGFKPIGERSRTVELDLKCRPCSLHGERPCRFHDKHCLYDIDAERVFDTLENLVDQHSKRRS